uniref:Uncharacterized protein n=1 Tax=Cucumis melo TaxID=3656 RepID=A0A9I9DKS6_CUCME
MARVLFTLRSVLPILAGHDVEIAQEHNCKLFYDYHNPEIASGFALYFHLV